MELAFAQVYCTPQIAVEREGPGAALAQCDSFGPGRIEDLILQMAYRGQALSQLAGRYRVERILLALHWASRAVVRRVVALRHEALNSHRLQADNR